MEKTGSCPGLNVDENVVQKLKDWNIKYISSACSVDLRIQFVCFFIQNANLVSPLKSFSIGKLFRIKQFSQDSISSIWVSNGNGRKGLLGPGKQRVNVGLGLTKRLHLPSFLHVGRRLFNKILEMTLVQYSLAIVGTCSVHIKKKKPFSCFCEQFIQYIPRIGPHIFLQQNRQTNPGNI